MNRYRILILIFCLSNYLIAQNEFKGQIIDSLSGRPISNANIIEFPTTNGTYSDSMGFFTIVSQYENPTFIVSHLSFIEYRYKAKKINENHIVIPMTKAIYLLGELNISIENIDILLEQSNCNYSIMGNSGIGDTNFVIVESFLEYSGGWSCLDSLFLSNLYEDIVNKSILPFGIVEINFTINEQGYPINITVNREIPELLLADLNTIFESMSQWKPVTQRGQNIAVNVIYRIRFK